MLSPIYFYYCFYYDGVIGIRGAGSKFRAVLDACMMMIMGFISLWESLDIWAAVLLSIIILILISHCVISNLINYNHLLVSFYNVNDDK